MLENPKHGWVNIHLGDFTKFEDAVNARLTYIFFIKTYSILTKGHSQQ